MTMTAVRNVHSHFAPQLCLLFQANLRRCLPLAQNGRSNKANNICPPPSQAAKATNATIRRAGCWADKRETLHLSRLGLIFRIKQ